MGMASVYTPSRKRKVYMGEILTLTRSPRLSSLISLMLRASLADYVQALHEL